MKKPIKKYVCSMCGMDAEFIATETNELLCKRCNDTNQHIKETDYPEKAKKYPSRRFFPNGQ